jgi:uncharacterized protein YuzE
MARKEVENIRLQYDARSDVLYCSVGEPREAISVEVGNGTFARLDPQTDQVVGFTVIDFVKRMSVPGRNVAIYIPTKIHAMR